MEEDRRRCLEMDVYQNDPEAIDGTLVPGQESVQRAETQILNSNINNHHNKNGDASLPTTLAGLSFNKRRRVSVADGEDSTKSRPKSRQRVKPSSSTEAVTTEFQGESVYMITPSPSMLSVVTYEAGCEPVKDRMMPYVSEQETRGITDSDSSSSCASSLTRGCNLESSSSYRETLVPPMTHEVISIDNCFGSHNTVRSREQLSSKGPPENLSPSTRLPIPQSQNVKSIAVEALPSTKSRQERLAIIFHDVFLLASILFVLFLVLQGIDMYSQWNARIQFPNDECIYVTVRTLIEKKSTLVYFAIISWEPY
jgi:hypothetical protein